MKIKLTDLEIRILINLIEGFPCTKDDFTLICRRCLLDKECDRIVFDIDRDISIHEALRPLAISKFLEYFTEEDLFEILL